MQLLQLLDVIWSTFGEIRSIFGEIRSKLAEIRSKQGFDVNTSSTILDSEKILGKKGKNRLVNCYFGFKQGWLRSVLRMVQGVFNYKKAETIEM